MHVTSIEAVGNIHFIFFLRKLKCLYVFFNRTGLHEISYYSHSCECRGVPFHSPLQLRALVVYTLLVVLSPQRVSQGLLYPPRGLIHTLFASPLDGTVSSSFPHPPPLQRRWQTHFPQLTLRLAQNFSPITYLRQGIEWLSHECELFTIRTRVTATLYLAGDKLWVKNFAYTDEAPRLQTRGPNKYKMKFN